MSGQKTVWVTGASSGLGLHTAMELQKDGWRVIAGARSFEEGEKGESSRMMHNLPDDEVWMLLGVQQGEDAAP